MNAEAAPAADRGRVRERALTFDCAGTPAVAILHAPEAPAPVGVAIVVGGPQYRVGGHRQFVDLARDLAGRGIAVFRFDYRGLGDSAGEHPGFPHIAPDIEAAVDAFRAALPALRAVALWALCDGVPAAAAVAARRPDVAGIAAVNPWVREAETHERTLLRHYYLKRPLQRDFWANLVRGRAHARDFARLAARAGARAAGRLRPAGTPAQPEANLAARTVADLARVEGGVLLLLSGQDLTAREFQDAVRDLPAWQRLASAPHVQTAHLPEADHTCAGAAARDAAAEATRGWLDALPAMTAAPAGAGQPTPPPEAADARKVLP